MYNPVIEELYEKIKTINVRRPIKDYESYHQKLVENNSTIATCMHHLVERDKNDAYNALEREFNINPEVFLKNPLIQEWQTQRSINNNLLFDDVLDNNEDIKNLFKQLMEENNIKAPIFAKFNLYTSFAVVERPCELPNYEINNIYNYYSLTLGPLFFKLDGLSQRGVLLHELEHINKMHLEKAFLAYTHAKNAKPTLNQNQFVSSGPFKKLSYAFENEADCLPACKSLENAKAFKSLFSKILKKKNRGELEVISDYHSPLEERYNLAVRILKFKQIEAKAFNGKFNQFTRLTKKLIRH